MENREMGKALSLIEDALQGTAPPMVSAMRGAGPYSILVATLLSLRTRDVVSEAAAHRLLARADTPGAMLALPLDEIRDSIHSVGFYNTKAKTIHTVSRILIERYAGRVPDTLEELLELPGVGRKTANLVLIQGFGKEGICVDTHVHRISNRLGYVCTKTPDATEFALREKLPKEWWMRINDLLVVWGQRRCLPRNPRCAACVLLGLCEYSRVAKIR
ncbi:MAG: endonuclease III [Spirochaetota bacterium]|jgi:endonuclease-3|nr:endonuclease III [Spirochaetota bacterium]